MPLVAEALLAQGRDDEADAVLDGLGDDARGVPWQVRARTARARLLVRRGYTEDAITEARDAVLRAGALDDVNLSADAYAALADVLGRAGRADDAQKAREDAYARYVLKGNVVAAEAILASRRA